jgi:hypothetical protein
MIHSCGRARAGGRVKLATDYSTPPLRILQQDVILAEFFVVPWLRQAAKRPVCRYNDCTRGRRRPRGRLSDVGAVAVGWRDYLGGMIAQGIEVVPLAGRIALVYDAPSLAIGRKIRPVTTWS